MRGTIAILVVGACAALAVPATPPSGEQIDKLIAQLGSSNFRQREAATKELEALGEPALAALKKATTNGDMEVANRAAAVVERITNRLENARRLEPTYVDLRFKDTTVEEVFAELAKQSGFPITIGGDKSKLAERRVTLETGRVAFWVAFEKLREQGGLTQVENAQLGFPPPGYTQPNPVPPPAVLAESARVLNRQSAALTLVDGAAKPTPTHIEGAVRIRSAPPMPNGPPAKPNELNAGLLVQAEPRLAMERIIGVKITRAIDNEGQSLDPILAESIDATRSASDLERAELMRRRELLMAQRLSSARAVSVAHHGMAPVRLGKGHKESTELRELEGSVTLALRGPAEELAVIENPLKAKANTAAKGKGDVLLRLVGTQKVDNGDYEVDVEVQYPHEIQPATLAQMSVPSNQAVPVLQVQGGAQVQRQIVLQGRTSAVNLCGVVLADEKQRSFLLVESKNIRLSARPNGRAMSATLTFRPADQDQGEPAKLAFKGTRPMQVEVPFVLNDVPLK
jgi:hypothetical protein